MNIDQANQIPLHRIVEHLGGSYSRKGRNGEVWYFSPFRPKEHTASFKIDERRNRWHDFGHVSASGVSGGDVIALWCEYHHLDRRQVAKDVLHALQPFSTLPDIPVNRGERQRNFRQQSAEIAVPEDPRFKIEKLHDKIFFQSLKEELQRRRISLDIANRYLKQVFLSDAEDITRKLNGFAFANHKGGYEISIPNPYTGKSFKTSTRPKTYTLIKGRDKSCALVFEGFWDFLSYLEMKSIAVPDGDAYVLNSLSFCTNVTEAVTARKDELKSISLYLDNDEAGYQATHIMTGELEPLRLQILSKEQTYKGFKDLNDWWIRYKL